MTATRWFKEITKNDASIAGGKGASLGEMTRAGFPIPPGFVIVAEAFEQFIEQTELKEDIDAILHRVNHEEMESVEKASEEIRALILLEKMPKELEKEILREFKILNSKFVAVRSSATSEDSSAAAWAGQLDTFLNTSEKNILENVKKCWASLFTPRAIFYRFEKGLHGTPISVAVVIQKMVESELSGIAFSVHPVTQDYNQGIIEAGYGLGEAIVSGQITPDSYIFEKKPFGIFEKHIADQKKGMFRVEGKTEWKEIPSENQIVQKLTDQQIQELAKIVLKIEGHYGFPVDVEWAFEKGKFYITQSRPITTLTNKEKIDQLIFEKTYTRDTSVIMQEAWIHAGSTGVEKKLGWKGGDSPSVTFYVNDGTIEVWENLKATQWYMDKLLEANQNSEFMPAITQEYTQKLAWFEKQWKKEYTRSKKELEKYIEELFQMISLFGLWYYTQLDERTPKKIRDQTLKVRNQDHFFDSSDKYIRESLKQIYPELKGYEAVILHNEISKIPNKETLQLRKKNFVMAENLPVEAISLQEFASKHPELEFKFNPVDEKELESGIKGEIAFKGKASGKVRILKRKEQINEVQAGEVIVSPMTTPDYLPAMKKAAAFVTDEGGITCHAAIVARELRKPCIIGTKIATQVLKDGDLVEVDADNGIVKILNQQKKMNIGKKLILGNQDIDASFTTLEMTYKGMLDKRITKHVGIPVPDIYAEIIEGRTFNTYFNPEELKAMVDGSSKALLANENLMKELKQRTIQTSQEMRKLAYENNDWINSLSLEEMSALLKEILRLQAECVVDGMVVAFADIFGAITNAVSETLSKRKNLKHPSHIYSKVLAGPAEKSLTEQAVEAIKNGKNRNELLKEYFWLNQGYIGRGLIEKDILDIQKEKAVHEKFPSEKELRQELNLSKEEEKLFKISGDIIFVKSLRADTRQFLNVLTNKITDVLSQKWNIESKYLDCLSAEELCNMISNQDSIPVDLKDRWKHSLFYAEGEGYQFILGDKVKEFLKENLLVEEIKNRTEVKGQTAYPGKVKGPVKLVFGPQHNQKVKAGDILVSTATSPQLLPAMKQAAAFITDVGGITSHAAIVARELKKPCIVGTKHATQIFKDGDLVEVDAEKGIIKILKKK